MFKPSVYVYVLRELSQAHRYAKACVVSPVPEIQSFKYHLSLNQSLREVKKEKASFEEWSRLSFPSLVNLGCFLVKEKDF